MTLTVNILYKGENGNVKKFAEEMISLGIIDKVRKEEGNISYNYYYPLASDDTLLLIDKWESVEALNLHHKSDMMRDIARLRDKYNLKMEVSQYIDYDSSNNDFETVIRKRTAVRKFSSLVPSSEKINKILEAGRIAPTAKNLQPIKIYVVKDISNIKKIDKVTPCRYNAPIVLIICGDKDNSYVKGDYPIYQIDASIVATHIMLEATNVGVDNIWIENFDNEVLKKEFNLPSNLEPVCLIPLGYKSSDCPININHNKRKSIEEIVEYI